jgi:hypothetical protein
LSSFLIPHGTEPRLGLGLGLGHAKPDEGWWRTGK